MTGTLRNATAAFLLGLLAAALLHQTAHAQPSVRNANFMLEGCRDFLSNSDRNPIRQGYCLGIVTGLGYLQAYFPLDQKSCFPKGATQEQELRVVVDYIERHPQRMHEDFRELTLEAWHEAWPCKGGQ